MHLNRLMLPAAIALMFAAPLPAQNLAPIRWTSDTATVTPQASLTQTGSARAIAGAPIDGDRVAAHRSEAKLSASPSIARSGPALGEARAMMVVGVAALIAGSFIDGTPGRIVMVGGAVIGLI